jgi:hypothetical protein
VADEHPLVWLESTPMMRFLRAWADGPASPLSRAHESPADDRYDDDGDALDRSAGDPDLGEAVD